MKKLMILTAVLCWFFSLSALYQPEPDGWSFYNYLMTTDSDELWEIYSMAFLGVAEEKSNASADDELFYDLVISNYGGHASCFGMSLLSLICNREGGHLGVCSPVFEYEGSVVKDASDHYAGPDLEIVRQSISVMHLRQLSLPMIDKLIDRFNDHNWSDPLYAYNEIKTALASSDYPLLSFMPASIEAIEALGAGAEAHTVVPYDFEDTGSTYRIYIYDPNKPYNVESAFYDTPTRVNYLEIDKSGANHDWKYPADYPTSDYGWEGSSMGPWTFIATNISDAKYKTTHPLSAGYLTDKIGSLIFAGDGSASQIKDEGGKQFYTYSSGSMELEKDPAKKTDNIIRWPFFHGNGEISELYFMKAVDGKDYEVDIEGKSQGYSCTFLQGGNEINLKIGSGKGGSDKLLIRKIGTSNQEVEIKSRRDLKQISLQIGVKLPNKDGRRYFKLSKLDIEKNAPVIMKISPSRDALEIKSEIKTINYQLELKQVDKERTIELAPQQMTVQPGKIQKIKPLNWNELNKETLEIKEQQIKVKQ